jgi:hypothetical protein
VRDPGSITVCFGGGISVDAVYLGGHHEACLAHGEHAVMTYQIGGPKGTVVVGGVVLRLSGGPHHGAEYRTPDPFLLGGLFHVGMPLPVFAEIENTRRPVVFSGNVMAMDLQLDDRSPLARAYREAASFAGAGVNDEHVDVLIDLVRSGDRSAFDDLAMAVGVRRDKLDEVWDGTVKRINHGR